MFKYNCAFQQYYGALSNITSGFVRHKCDLVDTFTVKDVQSRLIVFILYVPVSNFSVMSGRVFLGLTSTKQGIKCLAQGHNTMSRLDSHSGEI